MYFFDQLAKTSIKKLSAQSLMRAWTEAGKNLLNTLIKVYQVFLSYIFGGACRFYPSCSCYADEAIKKHGAAVGMYLSIRRLLKCFPGGPSGFDPVPENWSKNATTR